jgi:hypothetical protein
LRLEEGESFVVRGVKTADRDSTLSVLERGRVVLRVEGGGDAFSFDGGELGEGGMEGAGFEVELYVLGISCEMRGRKGERRKRTAR